MFVLTVDKYDCGEMAGHYVAGTFRSEKAFLAARALLLSAGTREGDIHAWQQETQGGEVFPLNMDPEKEG